VALLAALDRLERRIVELEDELEIVRGALEEEDIRRRRAEEAAQALQDQDPLTALPTRRVFNDRLAMSVVHARRQRSKLAVVLLGLDGFTTINETRGRAVGDDLLRSVATVLEQSLRQGDTVSRQEGDEFALLLPGFLRDDDVVQIAEKLRVSLRTPFTIGGHHVSVTGSLGIAIFPDDGGDAESLLHNASVALSRAKDKGGDAFAVHSPVTSARAVERQALENALRRALVGNELTLHYQPIVDAVSGRVLSVEALLRFHNTSGGLVPASDFLRELDATSLAVPLGLWSLRTACAQGRAWRERGHPHLTVAVNLTGRQLLHPSLVALVRRALGETGLPAEGLELEVAEADLVKSEEPALARLSELKRLGVRVAVDDFGTGEALLSRLERFPVDSIKIDRSVIRGIESDDSQKGVAAAAIALARARRLEVVAEGVETSGQRSLLVRWRCDRLQGNLCGVPMPAEEMDVELGRTTRG
jgi:diguanylate cyclase (GGDEF)-like protein